MEKYISFLGWFNLVELTEKSYQELAKYADFSYLNSSEGRISYGHLAGMVFIIEINGDETKWYVGELTDTTISAPIESPLAGWFEEQQLT